MFFRKKIKIPIEVSARHIHLSNNDINGLFGSDYNLKKLKQLSQPSDFSCEDTVDIKVGDKIINSVRIIGPSRSETQIEISKTDAIFLGLNPPIRLSGELENTPGITLVGPNGEINVNKGLIIAKRHIHCSTEEAKKYKFVNGQTVSVIIDGDRSLSFNDVPIRVKDGYKLGMHIDTDEGNAAGINRIGEGFILK